MDLRDEWIAVCEFLDPVDLAHLSQLSQRFYTLTQFSSIWEQSCKSWAINLPQLTEWAESWQKKRTGSEDCNDNNPPQWGSCYSPRDSHHTSSNSNNNQRRRHSSDSTNSRFSSPPRAESIWHARYQSFTSSVCLCTDAPFGINIDNDDDKEQIISESQQMINLDPYIWPLEHSQQSSTKHHGDLDQPHFEPFRHTRRQHKHTCPSILTARSESAHQSQRIPKMIKTYSDVDLKPTAYSQSPSIDWRTLWLTSLVGSPSVWKISDDRIIWRVPIMELLDRHRLTLKHSFHFKSNPQQPTIRDTEASDSSTSTPDTNDSDAVLVTFKLELSATHENDWNLEFWALKSSPKDSPFGGFRIRLVAPHKEEPMNEASAKRSDGSTSSQSEVLEQNPSINPYDDHTHSHESNSSNTSIENGVENDSLNGIQQSSIDTKLLHESSSTSLTATQSSNSHDHVPMLSTPPSSSRKLRLPPIPPTHHDPIEDVCRSVWKQDGVEWGWSSFLSGQDALCAHVVRGYLFFDVKWLNRNVEVDHCMQSGYCSFRVTGPSHVVQPWYHCITCGLDDSTDPPRGCCGACAAVCHSGHDVQFQSLTVCYCDCGAGLIPTHKQSV